MSDGTPPPPPPYGGGSQSGNNPYGAPPPSGDPYNQPPGYGTQPSDPYAQPPAYGAPEPQPGYGAAPPPPPYGQQPYGQPYGAQQYGQYPAAPPAYGAPAGVPGNIASMGKRFAARLIDGVIGFVVVLLLGLLLIGSAASQTTVDSNGNVTAGGGVLGGAIFGWLAIIFVFSVGYELVLIALKGATLGKMAMGIKVVREADGGLPGWGPSALRWVIPQVAGLFCGLITLLVYLSPFFDNTGRQQGWHDKVAHTLVINAR